MAAGVIAQDAITVLQRGHLGVPHGDVGGQRIAEQDPGRTFRPVEFIAKVNAVEFDVHAVSAV